MKGVYIFVIVLFVGLFYSISQTKGDSLEAETIQYVEEHYRITNAYYKNWEDGFYSMAGVSEDGILIISSEFNSKIKAFLSLVENIEEHKSKNRKITHNYGRN